jgi:hypothetical protein
MSVPGPHDIHEGENSVLDSLTLEHLHQAAKEYDENNQVTELIELCYKIEDLT